MTRSTKLLFYQLYNQYKQDFFVYTRYMKINKYQIQEKFCKTYKEIKPLNFDVKILQKM